MIFQLQLAFAWITHWIIGWGGVGALLSAIAWLLWYFTPGFLQQNKTIILEVAIGMTVVTLVSSFFYTKGYQDGSSTTINLIAAKDRRAVDAVKNAQSKVDDCVARNGEWDTTTGLCNR